MEKAKEQAKNNALKHLISLGYKENTDKLTIEAIEARIEFLEEMKANEKKKAEEQKKVKIKGIDGFKENIQALTNQEGVIPDDESEDYDALIPYISHLTPDERCNRFMGSRIMRLYMPIDLGNGKTIIRRVIP